MCFILTMRNVNIGKSVVRLLVTAGFILTMRNVNPTGLEGILSQGIAFYINYEECK